jgi:hypothetical protein
MKVRVEYTLLDETCSVEYNNRTVVMRGYRDSGWIEQGILR